LPQLQSAAYQTCAKLDVIVAVIFQTIVVACFLHIASFMWSLCEEVHLTSVYLMSVCCVHRA